MRYFQVRFGSNVDGRFCVWQPRAAGESQGDLKNRTNKTNSHRHRMQFRHRNQNLRHLTHACARRRRVVSIVFRTETIRNTFLTHRHFDQLTVRRDATNAAWRGATRPHLHAAESGTTGWIARARVEFRLARSRISRCLVNSWL